MTATGVTSDSLNILGQTTANVYVGNESHYQRFYVADNISHEVILGTDFLSKLGEVAYNFQDCTFRFRNSSIPMGHSFYTDSVSVISSVKIPPLSEVVIVANVTTTSLHGKYCIFEGTNRHVNKSLLVGKSLDRVLGNKIKVPIINTSDRIQEIQVNSVIGEIETIDEDALMTTCINNQNENANRIRDKPGNSIDLSDTILTGHEKIALRALLNEFHDIIGENISELGRTNIVQHVIETLPGTAPIRSKPYNIPIGLRAEVKEQLDEMQRQGLITISTGEWSSPIVLVKKKDNTWRFCVDYRKLNAVTVKHTMALSSIDNVAEIMHGKKYFSTIDLASGFFQVALHETSQEKSGFITPWGPYKWKVMPQGAAGSPSTFSRLSMALMADLISAGSACVYLDDYLMTSRDFTSHLQLLRTVFTRLRYAGLKYRLSKSSFCQKQVLYLGHVISQDGLSVAPHNVSKIVNFPNPRDKTGVRRLLGLFGFYRSFIKGFSNIAAPLIRLTNNDVPFQWTDECQAATDTFKSHITSSPILAFPDLEKQFILTTDASCIAVGGVLSQIGDDGRDHPIAFFSKALNKCERKWDACEQELFAILSGVKHFRHYLMNTKFRVRTDNKACTYILKKSELSPRLARWAIQLADYDYDVEHTPGRHNNVADTLSRAELIAAIDNDQHSRLNDEMKDSQNHDYFLGPIILYLEKGKFPPDMSKKNIKQVKADSENFCLINGVLYRIEGAKRLLAIPASQRKLLLFSAHESLMALHPGITKTLLKMKDKYWFPHMTRHVTEHIKSCGSCQRRKTPKIPMRVPLKNQMASNPFQVLSVDFQGPYTTSDAGNKYILVFTDHFTKWCEMIPTKDQLATTVAQIYVEQIFCRYGCSEILISDRGKTFMSNLVEQINKLFKVDHRLTSPYHPQTNGQVEVYNRSIANMLSHVVDENHKDWDRYVSFCQLAHNSSRHTIINASPSSLLMGRELRIPYDLTKPAIVDPIEEGTYVENMQHRMSKVWQLARNNISRGKEKQKKYYDKNTRPCNLKIGDTVLYFNRRGYKGKTSKLIQRWTGIYIIKGINETNADIQLFDDPDRPLMRVHLNNLKLYHGPIVRGDGTDLVIEFDIDSQPDEPPESGDDELPSAQNDGPLDEDPPSVATHRSALDSDNDLASSDYDVNNDNEHAQNNNMYTRNPIRTDASPVRVPSSASRRSDARSDVIRSQHSSSSEVRPRDTTRYALRRRPQRKRDPVYTS